MTDDSSKIIRYPDGSICDLSLPSREQLRAFKPEQRRRYLRDNPAIAAKLAKE